jgi:GTP-binding protein
MKITSAEFLKSAYKKPDWPKSDKPETAFVGKSNVGKSSVINSLLGTKRLVKTSSAPGKTRSINFFEINKKFLFTDLPGYGYAKGDKKEISRWKVMIEQYLTERTALRSLVHIVDIRRKPDELELMLVEWLKPRRLQHVIIANKCDKLSNSKCAASAKEIEKLLGKKPILYSTVKGKGKKELWQILKPFVE